MIVIGDSLVYDLEDNEHYTVNSYPGLTLENYIKVYNDFQEDEDIIVYCLGINDGVGIDMNNYLELKKGTKETYIIVPPFLNSYYSDKFDDLKCKDLLVVHCFNTNYITKKDGVHPAKETTEELHNCLMTLL